METKAPDIASDDERKSKIEDYLNGPRKKRKNYVIFATSANFNRDLWHSMNAFVATSYSQLSVSRPKNPQELTRQFGRNISLLVIDDQFEEIHVVLGLVKALKEKRRDEIIPVLFLTRSPQKLIEIYHKELLSYHESDEYIYYPGVSPSLLCARIKSGIDLQNRRVGRRYAINIGVKFLHLATDKMVTGRLVDLSLHGGILEAQRNTIFRHSDQIKVSIPVEKTLPGHSSDFIKVAAKVRRVFISGSKVSLSFEHITEEQHFALGTYLTNLVTDQMQRRGLQLRQALASSSKQDS